MKKNMHVKIIPESNQHVQIIAHDKEIIPFEKWITLLYYYIYCIDLGRNGGFLANCL